MQIAHTIRRNNKGFTLVELIVVLIVLALLAAILIPTLTGYINKARDEKNFQTAESVRVAAQAQYAEFYTAKGQAPSTVDGGAGASCLAEFGDSVLQLAGLNNGEVEAFCFSVDSAGNASSTLDAGWVKLSSQDKRYVYEDAAWRVDDESEADEFAQRLRSYEGIYPDLVKYGATGSARDRLGTEEYAALQEKLRGLFGLNDCTFVVTRINGNIAIRYSDQANKSEWSETKSEFSAKTTVTTVVFNSDGEVTNVFEQMGTFGSNAGNVSDGKTVVGFWTSSERLFDWSK